RPGRFKASFSTQSPVTLSFRTIWLLSITTTSPVSRLAREESRRLLWSWPASLPMSSVICCCASASIRLLQSCKRIGEPHKSRVRSSHICLSSLRRRYSCMPIHYRELRTARQLLFSPLINGGGARNRSYLVK